MLDDLLRARLATVSETTRGVLRVAALVGMEIDDELVTIASGLPAADVASGTPTGRRTRPPRPERARAQSGSPSATACSRSRPNATCCPASGDISTAPVAEALERTCPAGSLRRRGRPSLAARRTSRSRPACCADSRARSRAPLRIRRRPAVLRAGAPTLRIDPHPCRAARPGPGRAAPARSRRGSARRGPGGGRRSCAARACRPRARNPIRGARRASTSDCAGTSGSRAITKGPRPRSKRPTGSCPSDPPSATRARVLGQFGGLRLRQGRCAESLALADEAVDVARASGAVAELAFALGVRGWGRTAFGRAAEGIADLREALAMAEFLGRPEGRALGITNLSSAPVVRGPRRGGLRGTAVDGLSVVRVDRSGACVRRLADGHGRGSRISPGSLGRGSASCARTALAIAAPGPEAVWPGAVAMRLAAGSGDAELLRSGIAVAQPFLAAAPDRIHAAWYWLAEHRGRAGRRSTRAGPGAAPRP